MGKAENPLLGEGGPGVARDGCGAVQSRTWYRPSSVRASPCHLPPGEGLGSYFFVVLSVSSVLPWIRASIRVREYSIWL